jgi:hypothetical protein
MYVVRHSFHALDDDTFALPLWNLEELGSDLFFHNLFCKEPVPHRKPCDRWF